MAHRRRAGALSPLTYPPGTAARKPQTCQNSGGALQPIMIHGPLSSACSWEAMLGCTSCDAAPQTHAGIELMHMSKQRQTMGKARDEGHTVAAPFYALAASAPPRTKAAACHSVRTLT